MVSPENPEEKTPQDGASRERDAAAEPPDPGDAPAQDSTGGDSASEAGTEADGPGTDSPGADDPGADDPGTDSPGTDSPGTDSPGTDDPGTDSPGADDPGADDPSADNSGTAGPGADGEPTAQATSVGPPARSGNLRLAIAVGVALLVLVGGGVTILTLASPGNPDSTENQEATAQARPVVERFAYLFEQARNNGAFRVSREEVRSVVCSDEHDALEQDWRAREQKELSRPLPSSAAAQQLRVTVKEIRIDGDAGVARLTGHQAGRADDQDFTLVRESGQWRVCGLFRTARPPSQTGRPTSSTTPPPATTTEAGFLEPRPPGSTP